MRTHFYVAACIGLCLAMLNGSALPFEQLSARNHLLPDDGPLTINTSTYSYCFTMTYLNGLPGSSVFPKLYSGSFYSVGEGVSGPVKDQIINAWSSDNMIKYRKPSTPVVCVDMGEHYLIAQYYEGAPNQYGAMVLGQDGYFYNAYSFFAEALSSQEFKCYGLPIGNTIKHTSTEGVNYYTLKTQTAPCYGSKIIDLHYFTSVVPPSLASTLSYIGPCGGGNIYTNQ